MFCSPFFLHTLGPLFPKEITNLDWLENMTEDHCSVIQSFFSLHHFSHFCRCLPLSKGFTAGIRQQKPCSCSLQCAVQSDASTPVSFHIPASHLELQNRFFLANLANWQSSLFVVDLFRPQFCQLLPIFCKHLETADWEIPSSAAISTCLMPLTESNFNTATWLSIKSDVLPIF